MKPTGLLSRLRTDLQGSTCTISRGDPDNVVWDDETASYVPDTVEVYSGPCHIRPMQSEQRVVQAGERAVSLRSYHVEVPATVSVAYDDDVTIVTSPDAEAEGLVLRVLDAPVNELVTVRILECEVKT